MEVKKDGFKVFGEEVELQDGKRRLLTARLVSQAPSEQAKKGDKPSSPASGDGSAAAYDLTGGFRFVHFGPSSAQTQSCQIFLKGQRRQRFLLV